MSAALRLALLFLTGSLAAFLATRAAPGDPALLVLAEAGLGGEAAPALRAAFGTELPWLSQYLRFLGGLLRGDLGLSFRTGLPVLPELLGRLPVSLGLSLGGLAVAALGALPLGLAAAARPRGAADRGLGLATLANQALPGFWLGSAALWLLSARLGAFSPLTGTAWERAVLPVALLAFAALPPLAGAVRAAYREVASSRHLRAALARGEPVGAVLRRQGAPAARLALLAAATGEAAFALGGAAVLEALLGLPGLGSWAVEAARARDWPVLQATILAAFLWALAVQLAAGWLRVRLDPRLRAL
ncbi:ABC transporter permease [Roseomonas sp. OT10]|uniref:ABC transporter permease subunit n=1 Tax=Roseomonas cutis TaxID=2897332 RepID=UPI001E48DEEF|nr:ABC transporter permease [Roseomonas sp. OT10]UFN47483.1 ABC transporter permease [Roseomonas sp. OT10]